MYETLQPSYYPCPNLGPRSVAGVLSPSVVIIQDDLDHNCNDLPKEKRAVVSVVTVAAPRLPDLTPDRQTFDKASDLDDLVLVGLRAYTWFSLSFFFTLTLWTGAMGCGAYNCPLDLLHKRWSPSFWNKSSTNGLNTSCLRYTARRGMERANLRSSAMFSKKCINRDRR